MVSFVRPSSFAFDTAAERPRALKLAVGLTPSSLMRILGAPISRPRRSALSRGVKPSPRVTTLDSSRTGMTSK